MLDFDDSPLVCPSLLQLVFVITGSRQQLTVGRCVRVKNSYVKECTPPVTAPEIVSFDVQPCPDFYIFCGERPLHSMAEGLAQWTHWDTPPQGTVQTSPYAIVADRREGTCWAAESMAHTEHLPTEAV